MRGRKEPRVRVCHPISTAGAVKEEIGGQGEPPRPCRPRTSAVPEAG
ncbi:hypothetical protein Q9R46_01410 [Paenibacillus sp. RRE4]|nr:hypothetical protein [Paenibacillus sp. RRE4]MDT0121284.1 hypothetical protein [Paenibacillus sp. RRE4]